MIDRLPKVLIFRSLQCEVGKSRAALFIETKIELGLNLALTNVLSPSLYSMFCKPLVGLTDKEIQF